MSTQRKNAFNEEVGFRMRQVRSRNQVSQEQMGLRIGVSRQAVQRYEMGESPIPCVVIDTYARTFNAPVGFFYGETEDEPDRTAKLLACEIMGIHDETVRKCLFHLTGAIKKIERSGGQ